MDKNSPTKPNNLPLTTHHSTTHPSTPHPSPTTFISDNPELNAAITRYFKYVHNKKVVTHNLSPPTTHPSPLHHSTIHPSPLTNNPSPLTNSLVIHNEVLIDHELCGIYPLWFSWGIRNNKKVYCFTFDNSDFSNNILNWQDFLKLDALNNFHSAIDYRKVPYFEATVGVLRGILKPHGGDSLYDLASKLHTTFVNLPQKVKKTKITPTALGKIKTDFIDKGIQVFSQFQQKEKKYHLFLSYLPDSTTLFSSFSKLETSISLLKGIEFNMVTIQGNLSKLVEEIKTEVIYVHNFFKSLEPLLYGEGS